MGLITQFLEWIERLWPSAAVTWLLICASGIGLVVAARAYLHPMWPAISVWRPWTDKHALMPLLELKSLAERDGWNMNSLHCLDFIRALDEAGSRGLLTFFARANTTNTATELLRDLPRELVQAAEWKNLHIGPDGIMNTDCTDNIDTKIYRRTPRSERAYSDVHVARRGAKAWLRREAVSFRGMHEAEA